MKKKCSFIIATASVIALITMAFKNVETTLITDHYYKVRTPLKYKVASEAEVANEIVANKALNEFNMISEKSFIDFKEALAIRESNGNYEVVNSYGYLGKYQFGKGTLKYLGVKNISDFLKNPALQEKAFVAYVQKNKWILRKEIRKYVGKKVNGIFITESGIIAAAHLGGAGAVQDFFRSNGQVSFVDGYGTDIKTYLKMFSNYDITSIKAHKSPSI